MFKVYFITDNDYALDAANYEITPDNDLILYCPRSLNGEELDPTDFLSTVSEELQEALADETFKRIEIWSLKANGEDDTIVTCLNSKYEIEQILVHPNFFQVELKKKIVESPKQEPSGGFVDIIITYDEDDETFSFMGGEVDYNILVENFPNVRLVCGVFSDVLSDTSVTELGNPIYLYPYSSEGSSSFDFTNLYVDDEPLMHYTPTTFYCHIANFGSSGIYIHPRLVRETQGMIIDIHPMNPTTDNPHVYRVNSEDQLWLDNFTESIRIIAGSDVYYFAGTSWGNSIFVSLLDNSKKLYYVGPELVDEIYN